MIYPRHPSGCLRHILPQLILVQSGKILSRIQRRRPTMPDVKIEWNAGRTQEQKDKVAKAITDALVDIAKAPRENVSITFKDNPV